MSVVSNLLDINWLYMPTYTEEHVRAAEAARYIDARSKKKRGGDNFNYNDISTSKAGPAKDNLVTGCWAELLNGRMMACDVDLLREKGVPYLVSMGGLVMEVKGTKDKGTSGPSLNKKSTLEPNVVVVHILIGVYTGWAMVRGCVSGRTFTANMTGYPRKVNPPHYYKYERKLAPIGKVFEMEQAAGGGHAELQQCKFCAAWLIDEEICPQNHPTRQLRLL